MKTIQRFAALCSIVAASLIATPALAWDAALGGTIASIEVTDGWNQGFRVSLNAPGGTGGAIWLCPTGSTTTYMYLNETDSNYRTYVATLLAARASGSQVTIYSTLVGGYCHIGYLVWW